jgi:hypothetical protein
MLQAVELPTSIANLDSSLANVDTDALPHVEVVDLIGRDEDV